MESESQRRLLTLNVELESTAKKLRCYELLEEEIDNAVLRSAATSGGLAGGNTGSNTSTGGTSIEDAVVGAIVNDRDCNISNNNSSIQKDPILLQYMRVLPSHPERRVHQAVQLAHKLLDTEKQCEGLSGALAAAQADVVQMKQQVLRCT